MIHIGTFKKLTPRPEQHDEHDGQVNDHSGPAYTDISGAQAFNSHARYPCAHRLKSLSWFAYGW